MQQGLELLPDSQTMASREGAAASVVGPSSLQFGWFDVHSSGMVSERERTDSLDPGGHKAEVSK